MGNKNSTISSNISSNNSSNNTSKTKNSVFASLECESVLFGNLVGHFGRKLNLSYCGIYGSVDTILVSQSPNLYTLTIEGNQFEPKKENESYTLTFRYIELLKAEEIDIFETFRKLLVSKYESEFIVNIYFFYLCFLIQDYQLKQSIKNSDFRDLFPVLPLLSIYLPVELSTIVQRYILAEGYVAKGEIAKEVIQYVGAECLYEFDVLTENLDKLTEEMELNLFDHAIEVDAEARGLGRLGEFV